MAVTEDNQQKQQIGSDTVNDLVANPQLSGEEVLPLPLNSLNHVTQNRKVAMPRVGGTLPFQMMLDVPITLVLKWAEQT